MSTAFRTLLNDLRAGNRGALNDMMPAVYAELRRLAELYMHRERPDHTLQPTALVHEAYLRLVGQEQVDWRNRAQVLGVGARMMRRVLLDYASARNANKRAGKLSRAPLDEDALATPPRDIDFIDLDRALTELGQIDPQQAAVVELRFYGGLTNPEVGEALGISEATVQREWTTARLWLMRHISEEPAG